MAQVEIRGASDDLIEVEGDITEEFAGGDEIKYLAFSDGTLLSVEYAPGGLWRVLRLKPGTAAYEKTFEATDPDDEYSDRVTLTGDISWVVCGDALAKANKRKS